jgi:hypothetical protein
MLVHTASLAASAGRSTSTIARPRSSDFDDRINRQLEHRNPHVSIASRTLQATSPPNEVFGVIPRRIHQPRLGPLGWLPAKLSVAWPDHQRGALHGTHPDGIRVGEPRTIGAEQKVGLLESARVEPGEQCVEHSLRTKVTASAPELIVQSDGVLGLQTDGWRIATTTGEQTFSVATERDGISTRRQAV